MDAKTTGHFLDHAAVRAFIARSHRHRFAPKQTILQAGDTPESLYLILEGSVSVMAEDEDGREMVLAYRYPGEFFGEMCLFPELNERSAVVRTRGEVWVSVMPYADFRAFCSQQPDIMFVLAGQLALALRDTSRRLADLNFLDVSGRVERALQDLAAQPDAQAEDDGVSVSISRQELGRIAGCSREMAGRVLKLLEQDGVIRSNGRRILVLKPVG